MWLGYSWLEKKKPDQHKVYLQASPQPSFCVQEHSCTVFYVDVMATVKTQAQNKFNDGNCKSYKYN